MPWTPPGAGELREKVSFRRGGSTSNVGGYVVTTFADLKDTGSPPVLITRSSRLQPMRGGEVVQAARLDGVSAWECVIRSDSFTRTLTTDDQLVNARDNSKVYAIRYILDLQGLNACLVLTLDLNALPDGKT